MDDLFAIRNWTDARRMFCPVPLSSTPHSIECLTIASKPLLPLRTYQNRLCHQQVPNRDQAPLYSTQRPSQGAKKSGEGSLAGRREI